MFDSIRASRRGSLGVRSTAVFTALATLFAAGSAMAQAEPTPIQAPQPSVPEIFTLQGQYVRLAYNNEGYATLGYRVAQGEVGNEWMLLMVGVTLRKPAKDFKLKRDAFSVRTPDGKVIPLATQSEYRSANLRALNKRASVVRDSINYFPAEADQACALSFFSELGSAGPSISQDEAEVTWRRACAGRLYFRIPGGIKVGQHWLDIKFADSEVQVPFRILTKDEEKTLEKQWQTLKKEHEKNLGM